MFCFRGFICLALVWSLGSMVLGYGGRTWNIFGHSIPGQWNQTPDRHIIKGLRFRISPTCTLSQNGYGDLRVRRLYIIRLEYSHARKYTDADAVVLRAMLQVREAIVIIYNRRRRAQAPLLPHGCSLPQSIRAFARSRGRRSARSIQNGNGVGGGSLERRGGVLLRRTCMCVCVCVCVCVQKQNLKQHQTDAHADAAAHAYTSRRGGVK